MSQPSQNLELLVEQLRCENETLLKENKDLSQEVVSLCHELARAGKKPGSKDQKDETIVSARDAAPRVDSVAILRRYHFTLPDNFATDTGSGQGMEEKGEGGNKQMILEESPKKSIGGRSEQKPPTTGYYEVMLDDKATTIDYKKDYRRFSYTDFRLSNVHAHTQHAQSHDTPGGNKPVALEDVIRWADKVHPRTQDDVMPLLMLCKDVISKILTEKLHVNKTRENQLKKQLDAKEREHTDSMARCNELQAKVREQQDIIARLMIDNGESRDKIKRLEDKTREAELEAELRAKNDLVASLRAEAEALRSAVGALEKRIQVQQDRATKSASQDVPKSPSQIVASINQPSQLGELLLCALRKLPSVDTVQQSDLDNVPATTCRAMCRALIARLRAHAPSWVKELAELLDTTPSGLPGVLVEMYEEETALMKAVKGKDMQVLSEVARMDNFVPVVEVLKLAVEKGTITIETVISECTGRSKEAILHEWTAMSSAELQHLLRHKDEFSRWLSRKDNLQRAHHRAADRRAHVGMLDLSVVSDDVHVATMPIGEANVCVCGIFAMKRVWDLRSQRTGQQLVNIMRVTRMYFIRTYGKRSLAESHLNRFLATVVAQARCAAGKTPPLSKRCVAYARVAGIISPEEWCESTACFLADFYDHVRDLVLKVRGGAGRSATGGGDGKQQEGSDSDSDGDGEEGHTQPVGDAAAEAEDVSDVMHAFVSVFGECDMQVQHTDMHMLTGRVMAGRHGTCVAHRSVDQLLERASQGLRASQANTNTNTNTNSNNGNRNSDGDGNDGETAEGAAVVRECIDSGSGGGFELALWDDKNVTFEQFQMHRVRTHQLGMLVGRHVAEIERPMPKENGVWVDALACEMLDMWYRCKDHRDASLRALHKEILLKCGGAFDLGSFTALMLRAVPPSSSTQHNHTHVVSDWEVEALFTQLAGPSDQIDPTEFIDTLRDLIAGNAYRPGPLDPTLPGDHVVDLSTPTRSTAARAAGAAGATTSLAAASFGGASPDSLAGDAGLSSRAGGHDADVPFDQRALVNDVPFDQRALVNDMKVKDDITVPSHGEGI